MFQKLIHQFSINREKYYGEARAITELRGIQSRDPKCPLTPSHWGKWSHKNIYIIYYFGWCRNNYKPKTMLHKVLSVKYVLCKAF